jgi:hypothetical protein
MEPTLTVRLFFFTTNTGITEDYAAVVKRWSALKMGA